MGPSTMLISFHTMYFRSPPLSHFKILNPKRWTKVKIAIMQGPSSEKLHLMESQKRTKSNFGIMKSCDFGRFQQFYASEDNLKKKTNLRFCLDLATEDAGCCAISARISYVCSGFHDCITDKIPHVCSQCVLNMLRNQ